MFHPNFFFLTKLGTHFDKMYAELWKFLKWIFYIEKTDY